MTAGILRRVMFALCVLATSTSYGQTQEQVPVLLEIFHRGLVNEDRQAAGNTRETADFLQMLNTIESLRRSGLTQAVSTLTEVVESYPRRYPGSPSHLRRLRVLLADFMINAGQLSGAEDILVAIAGQTTLPDELGYEARSRLQTYTKLLCKQNRAEECVRHAQRLVDESQRVADIDRAFNRTSTAPLAAAASRIMLADAYMQSGRWSDAEQNMNWAIQRMSAGSPFALPVPLLRSVVTLLKQPGRTGDARSVLTVLKLIAATIPNGSNQPLGLQVSLLDSLLLLQEKRYAESRDMAKAIDTHTLQATIGDRAVALRNYIIAVASRRQDPKLLDLVASRYAVESVSARSNEGYSILTHLLNVREAVEENLLALGSLNELASKVEAFELIQHGTTHATERAIAAASVRYASGQTDLAPLIRERQDVSYLLDAARQQRMESQLGMARIPTAGDTDLLVLEKRLANLEQEIAARFPDYHELSRPTILSVNQAQQLLTDNQALISWFVGEEAAWGVVVRSTGTNVVRLHAVPQTLRHIATTLRKAVELGPAGFVAFPAQKAHELYESLFAPLASGLAGVKTIYVVPDSSMPSLPLSVLLTKKPTSPYINPEDAEGFAKAPWLVRDYAMSVLPTISSLRALLRSGRKLDSPMTFYGVGDPLLADHPSLHPGNNDSPSDTSSRSVAFRGVLADVGQLAKLASLPETADELTLMAAAFPQGNAKLSLREEAIETRLKATDLSNYGVIAFATHGLVAGEFRGLSEPGLVMTPPATATRHNDGLLAASEIAALKMNADWVLLSACNTGSDESQPVTPGLGSLAKAFFYAGARTLLVSHWRVPSLATVELTTRSITQSLANSTGKAEAHRQAMLEMIDSGKQVSAHPSSWGGFTTIGLAD